MTGVIPFAEWLPDQPALNTAALIAKNVLPAKVSYLQFKAFSNSITALSERAQGALAVKIPGGGTYTYCGTATKLYEIGAGASAWTDRSGSTYACAAHERWSVARYGGGVYAANIDDDIQTTTIGGGSNFADLSATAPRCRHLAIMGGLFLMAGNTWDASDGYKPGRLWWPGRDQPSNWPTPGSASAIQVQSDKQDLSDGGAITGMVGNEQGGHVICEGMIWAARYPTRNFFDFVPVEHKRGSRFPGTVQGDGRFVFYLGDDGFYMFDGIQSLPIGTNKVDNWFLADLDAIHVPRLSSAIDPVNKLYMVAYPGTGNSGGNPSKILIYNWSVNRWTYVETDLELLVSGLTLGYTLDSLDALGYTLDTLPYSLDADVWKGGVPLLAGFDTSHRYGFFNGTAMAATLTTGEVQHSPGERSQVSETRPMVSGAGATLSVTPIYRDRQIDSTTTGSASTINAQGVCPMVIDARYHRYQVNIPSGGFTHAQGIEATFVGTGN